jgi:protein tyrosine/serine phosphatase
VPDPVPTPDDFARRHVEFEACFNFRDVGGYPAADGRTVRWGRLYRSGALHRMTAADVERARALGIATMIDLRRPDEIAAAGGAGPLVESGVRHVPVAVIPDGGSEVLDARYGAGISGPRYVGYLEVGGERYADAVRLLAGPETYPAVVHCSAGKDRTGTTVALVLEAVGVPREIVVADFALTNRDVDRQFAWMRATGLIGEDRLREGADGVPGPEGLRRSLGVPVEAIEYFLAHLDREFGSPRGYLEHIGIDDATVAALRDHLTEPAGA